MKHTFSLRQIWTAIILFAVILPTTVVVVWYGQHFYNNELNRVLHVERQSNMSLLNQVESEVKRYTTLLRNKSDPLSFLINRPDDLGALNKINTLLRFITDREEAIHEVVVLTNRAEIIAIVDPDIDMVEAGKLSLQEKY